MASQGGFDQINVSLGVNFTTLRFILLHIDLYRNQNIIIVGNDSSDTKSVDEKRMEPQLSQKIFEKM